MVGSVNIPPNKRTPVNQRNKELTGNTAFFLNKNLSFKGLPKYLEVAEKFGEDFGEAAGKHFKDIIEQAGRSSNSGLKINSNDTITFSKEQSLSKKVLEMITYPVTGLPLDLANGVIGGLKKISWFNERLNGLSDKSFILQKLEARKQIVENKSNVAAIKNYFELLEKGGDDYYFTRFAQGHKRIAPLLPNYSSQVERPLNRAVTGLIPAFFLANDAFNLSMYMKNDKDTAKKEKKRRFNQELTRIGITVAAMFAVMGLFSKQCNKSKYLTAGINAGIVVVSEIIGRLMAGNPVLPVNAEQAKEYAEKRNKIQQNNTSKPDTQQTTKNTAENKSNKKEKSFLTLSNILKIVGGLIAFGFAAEKISKIGFVETKLGEFKKWYTDLYTKEFKIERDRFDKIIDKLRENKFNKMADFYENKIIDQEGEMLTIGKIKDKKKYILIHQVLASPVTFAWKVLTMPYNSLVKPLIKAIKEPKVTETTEAIIPTKEEKIELVQKSIRFLEKIRDDEPEDFTRKVNQKLISSFDNLTKSNYKNSELSVIVKTSSSAITTGFLIADNYNMVMIDSKGKDKELAEQKARERAIQRGARLTYEAFILNTAMKIFAVPYNASLLASLAIAGGLRVITEMVERKAVGLPLGESTREEINQTEKEHLSATGLKGSYFRTMAKLAGKKTLAERRGNDKKS